MQLVRCCNRFFRWTFWRFRGRLLGFGFFDFGLFGVRILFFAMFPDAMDGFASVLGNTSGRIYCNMSCLISDIFSRILELICCVFIRRNLAITGQVSCIITAAPKTPAHPISQVGDTLEYLLSIHKFLCFNFLHGQDTRPLENTPSPGVVVISSYSLVFLGKRLTKGTRAEPYLMRPQPASALVM